MLLLFATLSFLCMVLSCSDHSRDCPFRSPLCQSSIDIDRQLMISSCPFTCGICDREMSAAHPQSNCRDTVIDCQQREHLCKKAIYRRMMTKQCSLTCGFCSPSSTPESITETSEEVEEIPKRRGRPTLRKSTLREIEESGISIEELVSLIRAVDTSTASSVVCRDTAIDCFDKKSLCLHKGYATLVQKVCRKTCDLCDTISSTTTVTSIL